MKISNNTNKKIKIEVAFTNNFDLEVYEPIIKDSVCAVIDTLMATSTITTIFSSNCNRIILSKEKNEAYKLKKILNDYLLCGEENGLRPEGFDYGNLPLKFSGVDLRDKKIILKTTNGTVSFFKLLASEYIFAISLLNLSYSMKVILELAIKNKKNIFLVCSGRKGTITYDDVYTAGLAIKYLMESVDLIISDSAKVALDVANSGIGILEALEKSESGEMVKMLEYFDDLKYCTRLNIHNVIPRLKVLDLNVNLEYVSPEDYKDLYDIFMKTREVHAFDKLLLLEPF